MKAFDRNINIAIIQDIRNSEKISIDDYIDKVLVPLREINPTFLETLYKDITYVLDGLDKEGDNDLIIEDGDFVLEDGDFKLTGYQTRLHDITVWLHMESIKNIQEQAKEPSKFFENLENFNSNFLTNYVYTPEYKLELDKIKESLKKERKQNYENGKNGIKKFLDPDILELKPNIMGIGININEIINKFRKK